MAGLPRLCWSPVASLARLLRSSSKQYAWILYPILVRFALVQDYRSQNAGFVERSPTWFAAVELLKLAYTLFSRWRVPSPTRNAERRSLDADEESYFSEQVSEQSALRDGRRAHWSLAGCTGIAWVAQGLLYASAYDLSYGFVSVQAVAVLSLFLVLFSQSMIYSRPLSTPLCQSLAMQLIGTLLAASYMTISYPICLFSIPLVTSATALWTEFCYRSHPTVSFHDINLVSFLVALSIHVSWLLYDFMKAPILMPETFSTSSLWLIPMRAAMDLCALHLIYDYDSLLETVLTSLGATLALLSVPDEWLAGVLVGCAVSLWASLSYFFSELGLTVGSDTPDSKQKQALLSAKPKRSLIGVAMLAFLGVVTWFAPGDGATMLALDATAVGDIQCAAGRRPLAFSPPVNRTYHHFDDVLLVVFFSHARYDVNLDHYRAVYADYFPNIVFVGPKSREDLGFRHSYDVLTDSYQSDEELIDQKNWKMAGRMAHHMLYTAIREYPCYSGYLWAPFDTFLNIPRLEQFDQKLFWYHSPFGKYVPNIALGGEEENQDRTRHPPSANISPDPALNLTEGWRGWGPDWWWGDPDVGVAECMSAFLKTPESQRSRLSLYLGGQTRFIGGSVDTLYIPGHHRGTLMETLALFLETNCFLEIALPTVVHLIVPFDEDILYVDHHWIWYPPFNGDFVRQQWSQGMEVDTFHTFHWGERQDDGSWKGDPRLVEDTRALLQESAKRQRTALPLHTD